jgi:hypothetical protein
MVKRPFSGLKQTCHFFLSSREKKQGMLDMSQPLSISLGKHYTLPNKECKRLTHLRTVGPRKWVVEFRPQGGIQ